MKVLRGINIEEALRAVVEPFTLYILDQGIEERIIILPFKVFPLALVFFRRNGVYNTIPPLKHLLPSFFNPFPVFFRLLGPTLALRRRLGGLGISGLGIG